MYNLKLFKDEKIVLIDDDVLIKNNDTIYTIIITNQRLLVLDYPSSYGNSMEDLRILGRMNYIKKKEIILEKKLSEIKQVIKDKKYSKIVFLDDTFIELKADNIINKLC